MITIPKSFAHVQNFIQRLFCNASVSRLSRLRKYNKPARGSVSGIVNPCDQQLNELA